MLYRIFVSLYFNISWQGTWSIFRYTELKGKLKFRPGQWSMCMQSSFKPRWTHNGVLFTLSLTIKHALAMLAQLQYNHIMCLHVFFSSCARRHFPNDSLFIVWNNESRAEEDFKQLRQYMLYLIRCNGWVEASKRVVVRKHESGPKMWKREKKESFSNSLAGSKCVYSKPSSPRDAALILKRKKFHCLHSLGVQGAIHHYFPQGFTA